MKDPALVPAAAHATRRSTRETVAATALPQAPRQKQRLAELANNDRHFFNWGVVTHISGAKVPRFSPVYDTARALFWNTDEMGLTKFDADFARLVRKYVAQSYPKTGWDGLKQPNHFQLIRKLAQERPIYRNTLMQLNVSELPRRVESLLEDEFKGLVSPLRKRLVVGCLRVRMADYAAALTL